MPKIFRAMRGIDGKPQLGASASTLGVRPTDISADEAGLVRPGDGGMSVSDALVNLPRQLIPKRLGHLAPRARAKKNVQVWKFGAGEFVDAMLTSELSLIVDKPTHALVSPASQMKFDRYLIALHSTQNNWVVDESGD